jgi:hypothetical protein
MHVGTSYRVPNHASSTQDTWRPHKVGYLLPCATNDDFEEPSQRCISSSILFVSLGEFICPLGPRQLGALAGKEGHCYKSYTNGTP